MSGKIKLRAVLYQDGEVWIAQGLEHDIAAFSDTLAALPEAFNRAVAANVIANVDLGRVGLEGVPPAPERFVAWYDAAKLDISAREGVAASGFDLEADMRLAEAA